MTPRKKRLDDYSALESPLKVKVAADTVLYAYGKGNIHLTVLNGNDKFNTVLNDVLFVPKLQNKLFYLPPSIPDETFCIEKTNHSNCGTINLVIWGTIT